MARAGINEKVLEKILISRYGLPPEEARVKAAEVVECVTRYGEINDVQLINSIQDIASSTRNEREFWKVLKEVMTPAAINRYIDLLREQGVYIDKLQIGLPKTPKHRT